MSRRYDRRDERNPNPAPIRITERDLDILEMVYNCRFLSTQQLQKLFFPSMHQTYDRLKKLYDHGLLNRAFMGQYADMMNSPLLYVIDKAGADWLHLQRQIEVNSGAMNTDVSVMFMQHTMAINDVRIAIMLACQQAEHIELVTWVNEHQVKQDYDRVTVRASGFPESKPIVPDSYFFLKINDELYSHCFLELDRGTMKHKRFEDKIRAYLAYYRSGAYQQRYNTRSLRILTVTTGQGRSENLREVTENISGGNRFWFTDLAQITPETVLTQPIWMKASHGQQRFALIE